ncbi:MAG: CAP domain-containing protein [Acidobacteriota bacterium]|nr:CAP domain-containing protein [Acidobacteriota bacterium]
MERVCKGLVLCLALVGVSIAARAQSSSYAQQGAGRVMPAESEQLFALANNSRAQSGAGQLQWDPALAAAARQHCLRMAAEGPISHRYGGEPDLANRAGQAGAHFNLIEENVAVGSSPSEIHNEWMHSPGHRSNLLNPEVNRVGIAVVAIRGVLYAAADYSRNVVALSRAQVEARVAQMLRPSGVPVLADPSQARAACVTDQGIPSSRSGLQAHFVMRWQDSELAQLPEALQEKLASRRYRYASIGSCPARGVEGTFTAYRVAVLLF